MRNVSGSILRIIILIASVTFTSVFSAKAQQTVQEANYVHDKMYDLTQQSSKVELPAAITDQVKEINKDHPRKEKVMSAQLAMLKVFYNKALSKKDIQFFGEQLLKMNSGSLSPIHPLVKKLMDEL